MNMYLGSAKKKGDEKEPMCPKIITPIPATVEADNRIWLYCEHNVDKMEEP